MSSWYGTARSNYVRIADVEAMKRSLHYFDIEFEAHPQNPEYYFFKGAQDSGGWPSWAMDDEGNELEFSFAERICPYMADGEVLIVMEIGAEKLRYLTGWASAYARDGRVVHIDVSDIYEQAARQFGCPQNSFARAAFMELPAAARRDESSCEHA